MFSLTDILQISVIICRVGFLLLLLFLGSSSGIFSKQTCKVSRWFLKVHLSFLRNLVPMAYRLPCLFLSISYTIDVSQKSSKFGQR